MLVHVKIGCHIPASNYPPARFTLYPRLRGIWQPYHTAFFDSSARAAQLLQLLRQSSHFALAAWYSGDNSYRFATSMLAVAHHAHNAIILLRRECCWLVAATMFIWLPANGADRDPSDVRGIDETIRHIKLLSHMADVGDCITGEILGRISIPPLYAAASM